jgi:hypothetical protein
LATGLDSRRRAALVTPSVSWQLIGSGAPTWQGEGKTAKVAWAVGKEVGRRVEGGAELQGGAQGRAGAVACSIGEAERRSGLGKTKGTQL